MPIDLNPSSFSSSTELIGLSMEDVVSMFLDAEKNRGRDHRDDESQQRAVISAKVTPMGLIAILDMASYNLKVSRSLLTCCLSHHVSDWYDSLSGLPGLTERFYSIYGAAVDSGNPDLCDGFRNHSYHYTKACMDHRTTFYSISWVRDKLATIGLPLGLSPTLLFHVGLCWSITTTASGSYGGTIDRFLSSEVSRMTHYVDERLIHLRGVLDIVEQRSGHRSEIQPETLKPRNLETLKPRNLETLKPRNPDGGSNAT